MTQPPQRTKNEKRKNDKMEDQHIIKVNNVRLSFPALYKPKGFGDSKENPKYLATFILDPVEHKKEIAQINKAVEELTKQLKLKKVPADKLCVKGGDEEGREEYEGKIVVRTSSTGKPPVVDRGNQPVDEESGLIYAGCYVDASFNLWAQNNNYGKRINGGLRAVRFRAHGEPFGAPPVDADDEFGDPLPEDEDDVI